MQLDSLSDFGDVFLNKVNLWAMPAAASGVGVTALTTVDLFTVGSYTVTSTHAGMAFTAFVGAISIMNMLAAFYDKLLSIKLKEKELSDD